MRYIIKDPKTKLTKDIDDVKIADVQCGQHHSIALDDQGRLGDGGPLTIRCWLELEGIASFCWAEFANRHCFNR